MTNSIDLSAASLSPGGAVRECRNARGPRPLTGACLTLGAAAIAAGLGLGLASVVETVFAGRARIVGVPDEEVIIGLTLAGVAWLAFVMWLWMPMIRRRSPGRRLRWRWPALGTVLLAGAAVGAIIVLDSPGVRGGEFAVAGVATFAGGAAMLLWAPVCLLVDRGFVATTKAGTIDLRCPECEYSMNGLREARCPECGFSCTVDELFTHQTALGHSE